MPPSLKTAPLFVQTVSVPYFGSLGFREKEDCIALAANAAQEAGFRSVIVSHDQYGMGLAPDKTHTFTEKGVRIIHASSLFDFISTMRRLHPVVVFGNDRTPVGFLSSLFGKYRFFMSHQSQNPPIWWQRAIFSFFIRRFHAIKVANPYERKELLRLGVQGNRIHLIPIPIDYLFFHHKPSATFLRTLRKSYGIPQRNKIILTVAAIRSQKHVYTILDAAARLSKKRNDVSFVFVGKDLLPDEGLPSVIDKAEELGISDRVIVTGRVTNEEVRGFMHLADIGIQSSSREGQCLTAYEKAAACLPLCLSSIGSFTSVFRSSALFHDPRDGKKLADNIATYLKEPGMAKRFTRTNAELVRKGYAYENIRKDLVKLFRHAYDVVTERRTG